MEDYTQKDIDMELGYDFTPDERIGRKTAEEYWQRFLKTGAVSEYLLYRSELKKMEGNP